MDFQRRGRIAALKARLEVCEHERRKLLQVLATTGESLAEVSCRASELETEFHRLTNELKVLDFSGPGE